MPTYINVDHPIVTATCEIDPPVLRIALSGELDMSCTRLVEDLHDLPADGTHSVILDLTHLTFCDGAGLTALLALRDLHRSQGRDAQLAEPTPAVHRLLAILGEDGQRPPAPGPRGDTPN